MSGLLALVGGDEFHPGNEAHDEALVAAAGPGPRLVLPTAPGPRDAPAAVRTAREWFAQWSVDLEPVDVHTRRAAGDPALAERVRSAGLVYLPGGDPGRLVSVLRDTEVGRALEQAWRAGAALGGSSAGAMALGEWTLVRDGWPDRTRRRYADALRLVAGVAVVPHLDTFGEKWLDGALAGAPTPDVTLLGLDERTAAVWRDGRWSASGPGTVNVITKERRTRVHAGEAVPGLPQPG